MADAAGDEQPVVALEPERKHCEARNRSQVEGFHGPVSPSERAPLSDGIQPDGWSCDTVAESGPSVNSSFYDWAASNRFSSTLQLRFLKNASIYEPFPWAP